MKKIYAGLLVLLLAFGQWANASELTGAWELEYAIYKNQKGEVVGEIKDKATLSRKVLSDNHFTFITWDKTGKFVVAGSGTYTLKGESYKETVDATSEARLMGKTYDFNCTFKDGVWIHKGMEDGVLIEEHWRRVR
ncbi:MAG: hypothetical protein B0W54_17540 [Cellvibrio sp. 79]|nr:MAG: hypothetical protein B0W54_17540 [Cellvibrio sp. 79]